MQPLMAGFARAEWVSADPFRDTRGGKVSWVSPVVPGSMERVHAWTAGGIYAAPTEEVSDHRRGGWRLRERVSKPAAPDCVSIGIWVR